MASKEMSALIERKVTVERLFLEYTDPKVLRGNISSLSQLALIAGRLDVMIRRQADHDRKSKRYAPNGEPLP